MFNRLRAPTVIIFKKIVISENDKKILEDHLAGVTISIEDLNKENEHLMAESRHLSMRYGSEWVIQESINIGESLNAQKERLETLKKILNGELITQSAHELLLKMDVFHNEIILKYPGVIQENDNTITEARF